MGKNNNRSVNKNPKDTNAEIATGSTLGSQEPSHNRNDPPPACEDENKPKDAAEALRNAYDPSKIKETEAIPVIPDGYLKKPLYFLDDSGNKVQVKLWPVLPPPLARVENASPTRNDGVSSTNYGPADDNLHKETEAIWADCVICRAVRLTENMLRSVKCGHYFCKVCIQNHVNSEVKDEAKQVIPAYVRCPETKYCTESLPVKIVLDNLDRDVKYVWLAVHTFWSEEDRVAAGESSVLKFHDSKQKGISISDDNLQKKGQKTLTEEGAMPIVTKCLICYSEKPTETLLRPFRCEHYFCMRCLSGYSELMVTGMGKRYDPKAVGCPVEGCPKNLFSRRY